MQMYRSTSKFLSSTLLIALLAVISGCGFVNYEDVSDLPQFAPLVGTSYSTKTPFVIHGINMDQPIGHDTDHYIVYPEPGIAGREVTIRRVLPVGTNFEILGVRECTDCYFDFSTQPRREILIRLQCSDRFNDHPVYLAARWGDMEYLETGSEVARLNPRYFDEAGGS